MEHARSLASTRRRSGVARVPAVLGLLLLRLVELESHLLVAMNPVPGRPAELLLRHGPLLMQSVHHMTVIRRFHAPAHR